MSIKKSHCNFYLTTSSWFSTSNPISTIRCYGYMRIMTSGRLNPHITSLRAQQRVGCGGVIIKIYVSHVQKQYFLFTAVSGLKIKSTGLMKSVYHPAFISHSSENEELCNTCFDDPCKGEQAKKSTFYGTCPNPNRVSRSPSERSCN